jgi:hypothetical protein
LKFHDARKAPTQNQQVDDQKFMHFHSVPAGTLQSAAHIYGYVFARDYYRYLPRTHLANSNAHILRNDMHRIRWFYFTLVLLLAAPLCLARDLAIVVNKSNATSKVTAAELQKMLTTAVQNWPDGKRVKVFLTDPGFMSQGLTNQSSTGEGSADSRMILQRVYKMKPEEIRSLLNGHKADIQLVGSDEIVLTMVDNNPGAIGIVNVYSINSHVKVLKVDDKLPMEQGYLLHGN